MSEGAEEQRAKGASTSNRVIRASELAQYAYCAKAWWLGSVMGVRTTNTRALEQGEATHRLHGQQVWWSRALIWVAVGFVVVALLLIIRLYAN